MTETLVENDPAAGVHTFTFDDGPSDWTADILDLLAKHDTRATFFVVGQSIVDRENLLSRMVDEGHAVANHSFAHGRLTELEGPEIMRDLAATSMMIANIAGRTPTLFRAPFFGTDRRVNAVAKYLGMTHIAASLVTDDWMSEDPEAIAATVLAEIKPTSVVCLHDGIPPDGGSEKCTTSRAPTVEALRLILEGLG